MVLVQAVLVAQIAVLVQKIVAATAGAAEKAVGPERSVAGIAAELAAVPARRQVASSYAFDRPGSS